MVLNRVHSLVEVLLEVGVFLMLKFIDSLNVFLIRIILGQL